MAVSVINGGRSSRFAVEMEQVWISGSQATIELFNSYNGTVIDCFVAQSEIRDAADIICFAADTNTPNRIWTGFRDGRLQVLECRHAIRLQLALHG